MKYRKKPAVVEAMQLTEENLLEVKEWCNGELVPNAETSGYDLYISTLEGIMQANYGDYIIKGTDDEFYLRKAYIFEKIYEIVNQIPQLNDNQKIVLEWLKENTCKRKKPVYPMNLVRKSVAKMPTEIVSHYNHLSDREEFEVLVAFAEWGLELEKTEK